MCDKDLDELRGYVAQLQALLNDPHLGLFTWLSALGRAQENVARWYKGDEEATAE